MLEEIAKNAWHMPILMVMVLVYGILLNLVLFSPMRRVLTERKRRVKDSEDLSAQSRDALKSRYQDYEIAILEAHRRATHVKEEARNEANQYRSQILADVRAEMDKELSAAQDRLSANVAGVRDELKASAPALAAQLASKVLGREVTL